MANDAVFEALERANQARRLSLALDAIEARLDGLALGADPDAVVLALAGPVKAFDAVVREAAG